MVARRSLGMIAAVAITVVALIVLMPYIQSLLLVLFQPSVPAYSDYQIRRSLVIDANGGTMDNFTVDVPKPVDFNLTGEVQTVSAISYSPYPSESVKSGVPWLTWDGGALQGSAEYTITIDFTVHLEGKVWRIAASDSLNVSDIPSSLVTEYVGDEWKIVVNDPSIFSAAQSIVGGEQNVETALRSIYDWITSKVVYSTSTSSGDPKSSVETLSSRVGDCDDQAILFCALARASGIPAWLQLGAVYDHSSNGWGGHGWVQAYIPLRSGGGEYVVIDTVNHQFLVWSPDKFLEYSDDGVASHLRDYYYSFNCAYDPATYPSGEGPTFREMYISISHHDSSERITLSIAGASPETILAMVTRPGSVPA